MHAMRRLELIIEKTAIRRVRNILEDGGVKGYTVLPALSGYGNGMRWERDNDISSATDMVMVISISDHETIQSITNTFHEMLDHHIGLLSVTTVEVLRPDRF